MSINIHVKIGVEQAKQLGSQAWDLDFKGERDEAFLLYQEALEKLEQAQEPDHPEVAKTLDSLAGIYFMQ